MRNRARASGRFSKREIVGCDHRSPSSGRRPIASLNIGSLRRLSASLPSSWPAAIISMRMRMISARPWSTRLGSRGSRRQPARRDAMASRCSTSRKASNPPSEDMQAPSKRATIALPPTGDKPGSMGVDFNFDGHALRDPMGVASTPESYIVSAACPMPVTPDELSGLLCPSCQDNGVLKTPASAGYTCAVRRSMWTAGSMDDG